MQMFPSVARFVSSRFAVFHFCFTELVIRVNKDFDNSLQCFKSTAKTTATPRQDRNVMTQIGIDTFDIMRVSFVMNTTNMLAGINHINVAKITIRAVIFSRRCRSINF